MQNWQHCGEGKGRAKLLGSKEIMDSIRDSGDPLRSVAKEILKSATPDSGKGARL